MKVLNMILEKVFDGFYTNINNLDANLQLKNDLNLTQDSINLILSRIEVILSTRIHSDNFNKDYTLGNFRNLIIEVYSQKYSI